MGQQQPHRGIRRIRRIQNEARADTLNAPAEKTPPNHGWGQTTIEDFYREGMGVAGKE